MSTLAGGGGSNVHGFNDGVGALARFYNPRGISALPTGDLVIADTFNHVIRKISTTGDIPSLFPENSLTHGVYISFCSLMLLLQGFVQWGMSIWGRLAS